MLRRLAGLVPWFAVASPALAATTTITLQQNVEGYSGVEDTFLYAPKSVADVNYGAVAKVTTGISGSKERRLGLVRFDLRMIPPSAKVASATLWLYDIAKDSPARDMIVEVQALRPENADWSQGTGTGDRVPTKGAACWNYRRYDSAKWAGRPGLSQEGVDYEVPVLGSAKARTRDIGWVSFPLRAEVVQRWVADPKANAGMRVYPQNAGQPGDEFQFFSSEHPSITPEGPKLVLKLAMEDADLATLRKRQIVQFLARADAALQEMRKTVSQAGSLPNALAAIDAQNAQIGKVRSDLEVVPLTSGESFQGMLDRVAAIDRAIAEVPAEHMLQQASAANKARQLPTDFALAVADGMTNVLRPTQLFKGMFADKAEIELAKNEFEPVQVVIVPIDADVKEVTWTVSPLKGPNGAVLPAEDVSVSVMGYLKGRKPAIRTTEAWWPGPILDFLETVDVPRCQVQPLWVCVRTRSDTPAGEYRAALVVRAANAQPKTIELVVRVFDFAVPVEQHLLTVWGNEEGTYRRIYRGKYDKAMARAAFDFLLDHRLAVTTLYSPQAAGKPTGSGWFTDCIGYPTLSDPAELKRLWDKGSRWWNLGYLHHGHAKNAGMPFDEYVGQFIEMTRASLALTDAAGWPHSNLGIYFFDETRDFETLNKAAARVKAAFPDIPLMTTGYDRSYGVKGGPIDKSIDVWCPLTPRYAEDEPVIRKGREIGKKAWWYVCCGPKGSKDLNFFSQFPAVRSRLLMGVAAWKYKPDGFLYYRISGWTKYKKPIDAGPLTEWVHYYDPGPDGDGELICPGPDGPLSTLQFENLRDGIEDYEYYWLLTDLVARAKAKGANVKEAEALLTPPPDLLTSLTSYSEDPQRLRAERRKLAAAIEQLNRGLK